jgi:hypothetical protein
MGEVKMFLPPQVITTGESTFTSRGGKKSGKEYSFNLPNWSRLQQASLSFNRVFAIFLT